MERNNIIISKIFLDVICQLKLYNWTTNQDTQYANLLAIIEKISDKIMYIIEEEKEQKLFRKDKITLEQNTEETIKIFLERFKRWMIEIFPLYLESNNRDIILLLRDELVQNIDKVQK